jgi:hypothetical protein
MGQLFSGYEIASRQDFVPIEPAAAAARMSFSAQNSGRGKHNNGAADEETEGDEHNTPAIKTPNMHRDGSMVERLAMSRSRENAAAAAEPMPFGEAMVAHNMNQSGDGKDHEWMYQLDELDKEHKDRKPKAAHHKKH